jgi:hypothetical protein
LLLQAAGSVDAGAAQAWVQEAAALAARQGFASLQRRAALLLSPPA